MKKLMFLLAAASLSSVAFAQQKSNSQNVLVGESVDVMEVPVDKYKVETNHFFDNWFFSVGGGARVEGNKKLFSKGMSGRKELLIPGCRKF